MIGPTTTKITLSSSCFVYGTLMAPQVLQVLIGRVPNILSPVYLDSHRRHPVLGQVFPAVIPCGNINNMVKGALLQDLSQDEMNVFDWFESDEYIRRQVTVMTTNDKEQYQTQCYIWSNPVSELNLQERDWNFDAFQTNTLDWYLENTVKPCRAELDKLGIGVY